MLKKFVLSAAAAVFAFVCVTAFAAFDVNVTVNRDISEATVSGCGGSDIAGRMLSVYCLREGVSLSEAASETESIQSTDIIEAIGYAEADKNGNYTVAGLTPKSGCGKYVFYVKAYGLSAAASSKSIYIADESTVGEFVSSVSGKGETEVLNALVNEEETGAAGADLKLFELLSESGKSKAAKIISGKVFSKLSDVEAAVNDAAAQVGVLNSADGAALDIFMFPQKNELAADITDTIKKYNNMDSYAENSAVKVLSGSAAGARVKILDDVIKYGYSDYEGLIDNVGICVINYELANANGYSDVTEIIKSHCGDVLSGLDYNAYANSTYLNSLNKSLLNMSFKSAKSLITYISEYKPTDTGGSEPSGGSTGGGSYSGGSGGGRTYPDSEIKQTLNTIDGFSFDDMSGFEWANEAVMYLYGKGIVSGKEKGIFDPSASITREEFVKMAVVAFSMHDPTAVSDFADVIKGEWYDSFVASAAKNGLVNGVSETEFGIGRKITRQDVAVIIARAKNLTDTAEDSSNTDTGFSDNDSIADYAKAAVKQMKDRGYINGVGNGRFEPESLCTRAEAAKIIYEAIR